MQQAKKIEIIKELLAQINEDRNVDAGVQYRATTDVFTSREIAAKEQSLLFRDTPQVIGLSGDLPEVGSWFTIDDFGIPVLATRAADGQFNAFVNACRHRGVKIADGHSNDKGKAERFVCPFHAWTYSADGQLIGVAKEEHFGPVDKNCNRLVPLSAEERNGVLWVHPSPERTLNLDSFIGSTLDEEMSFSPLRDMIYLGATTIDRALNWKLANDTFGETYHFPVLHKDTLAGLFAGNNQHYETFGKHHRFSFATRAISAVLDLPEEEWDMDGNVNYLYHLFPNIQLNIGDRVVYLIKMYPHPNGDPGRSVTRIHYYAPQAAIDAIEAAKSDPNIKIITPENAYDPSVYGDENAIYGFEASMEIFKGTIEFEDYAMGEQQQAAAKSGHLTHLLFGHNEPALHHHHTQHRKTLNLPPLERVEP